MSKQLIVLITGANRGIGLALTRAYLERGDRVAATCRHPAKAAALHELKETYKDDLVILRMDVTLERSAKAVAEDVAEHLPRLDVLINNAGIAPGRRPEPLATLEMAQVRDAMETNALGPLRTTRALLPLLKKSQSPRIINVSSGAGSISRRAGDGPSYSYAGSKAALNMFSRVAAEELRSENVCLVTMTPGWVRTDMGGSEAELDPATVAAEMVASIDGLTMEQTSLWLDRHGAPSEYAW